MNVFETERDGEPVHIVGLELDEEMALADAVMRLLSEENFRGDGRDFLEHVYWLSRARYMGWLLVEDFVQTIDIFDAWAQRDWFATPFLIPPFLAGDAEMNPNASVLLAMNLTGQTITSLMLCWEAAWSKYKPELIKRSDSYKTSPSMKRSKEKLMLRYPTEELARAEAAEERFWTEVERIHEESKNSTMPLNRVDSYQYVKDYKRRGRNVIPAVLMRHWLLREAKLATLNPVRSHPNDEAETLKAYAYSAKKIKEHVGDYAPTEIDILFSKPEDSTM